MYFTGKERDSESGLDNFLARYYSGAQGRFTGPDQPLIDQDPADPQSWNLYSYARNNPLANFDSTGQTCVKVTVDGKDGFADDGDGKGCKEAEVKPSTQEERDRAADIEPGKAVDVVDEPGSLLQFLLAPPVPRYVENDVPLSENARKVLGAAYVMTTQRLSCLGVPVGVGGAGYALFRLGQPVPGSKPFRTPGSSVGTSPISAALRGLKGKSPVQLPTPVGGPGTGVPFSFKGTKNVGAALGRYAPFVGIAGMGVAAYQAYNCVSQ